MARTDRKDAILDAAIGLIATLGLEGTTHRAVDRAAGLPQGSTSYHFPRKTGLILAAAARLEGHLSEDCDAMQAEFARRVAESGMDAAIAYVGDELAGYADASRTLFLARMELTLAAARHAEFEGLGARLTEAARRPIAFFLKLISGGREDAPVETCAGLIDGIALAYATGQGPRPDAAQMATVFRALL